MNVTNTDSWFLRKGDKSARKIHAYWLPSKAAAIRIATKRMTYRLTSKAAAIIMATRRIKANTPIKTINHGNFGAEKYKSFRFVHCKSESTSYNTIQL